MRSEVEQTAVLNGIPSLGEVPDRRCGALRQANGLVLFRVWAPKVSMMSLALVDGDRRRTIAMRRTDDGHFEVEEEADDGQRYGFLLDDSDALRPDPCSLFQPEGVAGPSQVLTPRSFEWFDEGWKGIARPELVIYEMHIGTFTPDGTFEAAIERLDDLRALGINAIEIMPIAQFPGDRNWGYDGVLPYAAQDSYGGPHGLAKLVDAAHARGIAVILDVVYNHFGPEHAYHREFGPYFTDKYKTPWGDAINYDNRDSDHVRDYVLDNARMWLDEFHIDGLRLDAVHAIFDLGASHILRAIQRIADDVAEKTGREKIIIAESDLNDPKIIHDEDRGGFGIGAQWSDDFHHAVHALLTGERRGYYADYGEIDQLVSALNSPFIVAGTYSKSRGRKHGAPPEGLGGDRFVVATQNHDQVGNRAVGDRLTTIVGGLSHGQARQRMAACLLMFAPHLPMLFMGEEYGETNPFPFFCSFEGSALADAVRQGRKREFADFVDDPEVIPDPLARDTFDAAKLSWTWATNPHRLGLRSLYGDLITARRLWPALHDFEHREAEHLGDGLVAFRRGEAAHEATILFNLSDKPRPLPESMDGRRADFSSEFPGYAGTRHKASETIEAMLPFECIAFSSAR